MILAAAVALTGMAVAEPDEEAVVEMPSVGRGNCDLMASNTVRAVFRGIQQGADGAAAQVAVFEVVQNLAHQRVVRYGDGMMPAGMIFTVMMDRNLPGQPSSVVDEIAQMQPGEEAVMKIDHLFMFEEPQGINLRPCTRMARKPATPVNPYPGIQQPGMPVQPAQPVQPAMPADPDAPVNEAPAQPVQPSYPNLPVMPGRGNGGGYIMGGGAN